jgi:hypothetical protein
MPLLDLKLSNYNITGNYHEPHSDSFAYSTHNSTFHGVYYKQCSSCLSSTHNTCTQDLGIYAPTPAGANPGHAHRIVDELRSIHFLVTLKFIRRLQAVLSKALMTHVAVGAPTDWFVTICEAQRVLWEAES